MPIIGDDIESLELVKDGGKNTGIRVHFKADRQGQMQAMADSDFYLVRKNEELFAYKPKKTSILLRLQPSAKQFWPFSFVTPVAAVIYEGVDEKPVLSDLRTPLSRLGETVLSNFVKLATGRRPKIYPNIVVNRHAHVTEYIKALVTPTKIRNDLSKWEGVAVRGGDNIGHPAKTALGSRGFIVRFSALKFGEIKFIDPLPVLKEFPGFIRTLDNHKLKSWVENYREPVRFFLQFEFWNPKSKKYQWIDWKPECQLIVDGHIFEEGYYLDKQGRVFMEVSGSQVSKIKKKELYFRLNLRKMKINSIAFPENWTTKNVTGQYGVPGHFKSFPGFSIGNQNVSAVFRVGTRVFLEFRYKDHYGEVLQRAKKTFMGSGLSESRFRYLDIPKSAWSQYGKERRLCKGVLVWVHSSKRGFYMDRYTMDKKHWLRADGMGRIDTVLFDNSKPQPALFVECFMDMQDHAEGLSDVLVYKNSVRDATIHQPLRWGKDIKVSSSYSGIVGDHVGADAKPLVVNNQGGKNDLFIQNALYSLKKIRETHGWLRCMSRDQQTPSRMWKSPPLMLALVHNLPKSDQDMGPPSIRLGLDESYVISKGKKKVKHKDLALVRPRHIVHEFGHFVMAASIEKTKARRLAFNRKLKYVGHGRAFFRAPSNPNSALIEGWARFFSHCFGYAAYFRPPSEAKPTNYGEKIAHDVAIVLFELFQKEVLGASSAAAFKYVGESPNGDHSSAIGNYCISSSHYTRFVSTIWGPMLDMENDYQAVISGSANTFGIRQFCQRLINRVGRNKWSANVKKHFVLRNMATDL